MDNCNSRTVVDKCPSSSAVNSGGITSESALSQSASMALTFDAVFSKEEEKIAMEDVSSYYCLVTVTVLFVNLSLYITTPSKLLRL
jgi:hypothetical protein